VAGGDAALDVISNFENLLGSAKADTLTGDGNNNVIEGGLGNDTLDGGGHAAGGDTLSYAKATAAVKVSLAIATAQATGGGGTDTVTGFENLTGGAAGDTLFGDGGANTIAGMAGNDTIIGGAGADKLDGGAGANTLSYAGDTAGVTVNLETGAGSGGDAQGDTMANFVNITGGAGGDNLKGNPTVLLATLPINLNNNRIDGGDGDDTIEGGLGNDILIGGGTTLAPGSDTLSYAGAASRVTVNLALATLQDTKGAGKDTVSGFENLTGSASGDTLTGSKGVNVILGGAGNDTIQGGAGADTLDGQGNSDTVSYAASALGVVVKLGVALQDINNGLALNGDASGDMLLGFENILGSGKADVLIGDGGDNAIQGGLGNDDLQGGANGAGGDTVSYALAATAVTVNLGLGTATGGAGADKLSGFENIIGGKVADKLTGDGSANVISGGLGADILTGAGGADMFAFAAFAERGDRIADFVSSVDRIELTAAGFTGLTGGQVLDGTTFIAGPALGAPAPAASVATFLYDIDDGKLYFDDNGTGAHVKVLFLTLDGHPALAAGDFFIV
jgi:Ca2+-binding RTX toxin-like protein